MRVGQTLAGLLNATLVRFSHVVSQHIAKLDAGQCVRIMKIMYFSNYLHLSSAWS
jgi:hypothetical protein